MKNFRHQVQKTCCSFFSSVKITPTTSYHGSLPRPGLEAGQNYPTGQAQWIIVYEFEIPHLFWFFVFSILHRKVYVADHSLYGLWIREVEGQE